MADGFLIKQEKYLEAGIHIGTKLRVIDMRRFIYRTRNDGLYVLDLRKVDERIRMAGKMLSKFDAKDVVVVASRTYSSAAAAKFASATGAKVLSGRFIPGRFTNVARDDFVEPKLVIICDPKGEHQAVIESGGIGIPTIGLCDTDNFTTFIDWVIPCNNKGRRSLSLIFWLLAREMALSNGKVTSYDDFKPTLEEFEAQEAEKPPESTAAEGEAVEMPLGEAAEASEAPAKPAKAPDAPAEDGAGDADGTEENDEESDGPGHQAGASLEPPAGKEEGEKKEKKPAAKKKAAAPAKKAEGKKEAAADGAKEEKKAE